MNASNCSSVRSSTSICSNSSSACSDVTLTKTSKVGIATTVSGRVVGDESVSFNSVVSGIYSCGCVYRDWETDRKSTRLNSSHSAKSRMPSSA